LKTQLNLEDADQFYENLMDAHLSLTREQSEALNARLVLILANELGGTERLAACLAAAVDAGKSPHLQQS